MKPKIYFLEPNENNSQINVIRALANNLLTKNEEFQVSIKPIKSSNDLVYIIQHNNLTFGILIHADKNSASRMLKFMQEQNCTLLFCSSLRPQELQLVSERMEKDGIYKLGVIKNVFNPFLQCEALLEYQEERLLEIISLYSEEANKISEKQVLKSLLYSKFI